MTKEEIAEYFNLYRFVTKEIKVTEDAINKDPKIQMLFGRLNDLAMRYQAYVQEINQKGN